MARGGKGSCFVLKFQRVRRAKRNALLQGSIPRRQPFGYSCAMGKLAERYQDAARSGVYRVNSAEIPLRAAAEACARLLDVGVAEIDALAGQLQIAIAAGERRPHVVLIREGAALAKAPQRYAEVVDLLERLARECRAQALPLFAVLVDPGGALDLPRLYREHAEDAAQ
jgi:hypothetical protein